MKGEPSADARARAILADAGIEAVRSGVRMPLYVPNAIRAVQAARLVRLQDAAEVVAPTDAMPAPAASQRGPEQAADWLRVVYAG
jgi:hypothetical protein